MKLANKNKLLLLGVGLTLFLSYHLAIRNALFVRDEFKVNHHRMEAMASFPNTLATKQKNEKTLQVQLAQMDVLSTSFQTDLLRVLNSASATHQVQIVNLKAPHKIVSQTDTIATYIFDLEGSYVDILKTLSILEQKKSYGIINHLAFEKKTDYRSRRTFLQARVFLQQLR